MTAQAVVRCSEDRNARRPVSVLIVDDSVVARAALERIVKSDAALSVSASVGSALAAIDWLRANTADVVLLDLEMPGLGGLDALPGLLAAGGGARVLVVASAAREGARSTLRALSLGAADTLAKPEAGQLNQSFGEVLNERIRRLGHARARSGRVDLHRLRAPALAPVELVAVGSSTGGLPALADFFAALPRDFDAPVLLTQHLPPSFMPYFAEQVAAMSGRAAMVAFDGQRIERGCVLVAPGIAHLCADRGDGVLRARLSHEAAPSRCCPSVDPMFQSVAAASGADATAVVLTGMGRDGRIGAQSVIDAGGSVIAQDRATSAVWGMPGSVVSDGLASVVGSPADLARHLAARGAA